MKTSLTLLFLLPLFTFAQQNEGQVLYQEVIDFDIDRRVQQMKERMGEMQGMDEIIQRMKDMQKSQKTLLFTASETYYQDYVDPNEPKGLDGASGATGMRMMRPKLNVYQNLPEGRSVSQQDFMGKMFLIKQDMKSAKWKLTGETDTVAGYLCQKATTMKDTLSVTAWFTPQIPVPAGPLGFGQLPGLILKLDVQKKYTVVAQSVTFGKNAEGSIAIPTKGKEVTEEEFREIVAAKMKEMREMYGGERGGMRMMTH